MTTDTSFKNNMMKTNYEADVWKCRLLTGYMMTITRQGYQTELLYAAWLPGCTNETDARNIATQRLGRVELGLSPLANGEQIG